MTEALAAWQFETFTAAGLERRYWRRGQGPAVVVVHELPGLTPAVIRFGEDLVEAGFTVVMPLLVGDAGVAPTRGNLAATSARICVAREFSTWALGTTSPVVAWLRALARHLHQELGGVGVGAVGMCFSGGFALGMMVDGIVVAPVLSQPSLPLPIGKARAADLGLSPEDRIVVAERAAAGCQVLGLRYRGDRLVGERFASLHDLLGDAFVAVELESSRASDHSVLTEQRDEGSVRTVIDFLTERLAGSSPS